MLEIPLILVEIQNRFFSGLTIDFPGPQYHFSSANPFQEALRVVI